MSYYHGKRSTELTFRSGICFTSDRYSAATYGPNVFEAEIDRSKLKIETVEMTDEELREAMDDQEWPCDREFEREATIAAGYDAVEYQDVDERGQVHDCLRILTAEAFEASVRVRNIDRKE